MSKIQRSRKVKRYLEKANTLWKKKHQRTLPQTF